MCRAQPDFSGKARTGKHARARTQGACLNTRTQRAAQPKTISLRVIRSPVCVVFMADTTVRVARKTSCYSRGVNESPEETGRVRAVSHAATRGMAKTLTLSRRISITLTPPAASLSRLGVVPWRSRDW